MECRCRATAPRPHRTRPRAQQSSPRLVMPHEAASPRERWSKLCCGYGDTARREEASRKPPTCAPLLHPALPPPHRAQANGVGTTIESLQATSTSQPRVPGKSGGTMGQRHNRAPVRTQTTCTHTALTRSHGKAPAAAPHRQRHSHRYRKGCRKQGMPQHSGFAPPPPAVLLITPRRPSRRRTFWTAFLCPSRSEPAAPRTSPSS